MSEVTATFICSLCGAEKDLAECRLVDEAEVCLDCIKEGEKQQ